MIAQSGEKRGRIFAGAGVALAAEKQTQAEWVREAAIGGVWGKLC